MISGSQDMDIIKDIDKEIVYVVEMARLTNQDLDCIDKLEHVVGFTKRPWDVVGRMVLFEGWTIDISANLENPRYHLLKRFMESAQTLTLYRLWQQVTVNKTLGQWDTRYKGFFGGFTRDDLTEALKKTHGKKVDNTTLLTKYYPNPVAFDQDTLKSWYQARKNKKSYTVIKKKIRAWTQYNNLPNRTVYCALLSETCKTRDPRKRPLTHYGVVCYGKINLRNIPVVITFPIPKNCNDIICWHNMSGAIYYTER